MMPSRKLFLTALVLGAGLLVVPRVSGETWELIANNAFGTIAWQDMQYWKSVEGGTNGLAGVAPSATDAFVVKDGKILRSGNRNSFQGGSKLMNFGGYSLQLGDDSTTGTFTFDPTTATFARGGLLLKNGRLLANYAAGSTFPIEGFATVLASSSNPFTFDSQQAQYSNCTLIVRAELSGAEGTGIRIGGISTQPLRTTIRFTNPSGYKGNVTVANTKVANDGDHWGSKALFGTMATPGTITVSSGGCLGADAADAVVSAASISFASGSRLQVEQRGGLVKATTSLTVAEGTQVCVPVTITNTDANVAWPILQGPADSAFTESSFEVVRLKPCVNSGFALSVVKDDEANTKTLYISMEPGVTQIKSFSNESSKDFGTPNYGSSMTNRASWSDGELPHAERSYYSARSLRTPVMNMSASTNVFVFGGKSLTLGTGATFLAFANRVEIPRLTLVGSPEIISGQRGWNPRFVVTGGIEVVGSPMIESYASQRLTIASEIHGAGMLNCCGVINTSSMEGSYAFEALNTNFLGTVVVSQRLASATYRPQLFLFDGRNLGGKLPAFDPRALQLYSRACVSVTNKDRVVTLAGDQNRGIFIGGCGGFNPSANAVIDVRQPILLDGKMQLEGVGRTILGGEMTCAAADGSVSATPRANSNLVTVAANATLVAAHKGCLDGCALTFGSGSKLVLRVDLDDEDLTRYGMMFTKEGTAFDLASSFGGKLPLTLETASEMPLNATIGIVTVPTGSALETAVLAALPESFPKLWPMTHQTRITVTAAETGLTTIALKVTRAGTTLYVR